MKNLENYQTLRTELENLKSDWKVKEFNSTTGLDATYVEVIMSKSDWRKAKEIGCKKEDYYYTFFTTSTNFNGYELYEQIQNLCSEFIDLYVRERQL